MLDELMAKVDNARTADEEAKQATRKAQKAKKELKREAGEILETVNEILGLDQEDNQPVQQNTPKTRRSRSRILGVVKGLVAIIAFIAIITAYNHASTLYLPAFLQAPQAGGDNTNSSNITLLDQQNGKLSQLKITKDSVRANELFKDIDTIANFREVGESLATFSAKQANLKEATDIMSKFPAPAENPQVIKPETPEAPAKNTSINEEPTTATKAPAQAPATTAAKSSALSKMKKLAEKNR